MIRYFKKSFVRYLAYGFAIALLSFLFGLFKVKAVQVAGSEFYTPTSFALYNNISTSSSTYVPTNKQLMQLDGAGLVYGWGQVTTTAGENSPGASWCFSSDKTFLNGYVYSVQMVVRNENDRPFTIPTVNNYDMLRIGYGEADASTHSGTTDIIFFGTTYDQYGAYVNGASASPGPVYIMQYMFKSKLNATHICLPFKHTSNATLEDEYLYGVKIDIIGESDLVTNASLSTALGNVATAQSIQQLQQQTEATTNAVNVQTDAIMGTINNDNVSEASDKATDFFNNFSTNTHGLTGIITAPLNAITSITSSTCSPLVLPLPFVNDNLTLPCMRPIYEQFFGDFMTLYDIVVFGIVSYWIVVRIFSLVKDFKNPEHDEVEVMEL